MKSYFGTLRYSRLTGIGGILMALVCAVVLYGCSSGTTVVAPPSTTTGSLNVVNPTSATVVVTGPEGFTTTFTGDQVLTDLAPGVYMVTASAAGYADATSPMTVTAGQTATLAIVLQLVPATGSLNVNVNPASATVVVTGPASFTQTFTGDQLLTDLAPGQYSAAATAPGFAGATNQINVVVGHTSSITLNLVATPIIAEAPRAVYRDDQGNLIPIDSDGLQSGEFVFYAWLQDEPQGILPAALTSDIIVSGDPGMPLVAEQTESAPSFTQNLVGAWIGFRDATGVVRPVIGADVRWEIDQWWSGRVNSMQFGTSDDNRIALNYGVFDDQADTRTNNARLAAQRFPLVASQYPLYNLTGVGTPFVDGFTWVSLFSPDAVATGRIVAVATINGEEIGKQILFKSFAAQPEIQVTKTVDQSVVNLVAGTADVTWTITVTNTGPGDATNVDLSDFLLSGDGASYTAGSLPGGSTPVGDGFTYSFPLASAFALPPVQTAQLLGNAWSFAVLADATVTNTGSSVVSGNVGVSAGSAVTGFPPGLVLDGTIHNSDAAAAAAQIALTNAYVALGTKACTQPVNTALSNATLTPGVYCYDSSAALIGPLVLDAQGDPAAEFVFKTVSTLTTSVGASVSLINGANPCNVYWQVGSSAVIGSNTFFAGNILAQASITLNMGVSLSGRALARTGTVTLDTNAVNAPPACVVASGNSQTMTFTATVTAPGTYCNEAQILSYDNVSNTWNPVDLNAQACFTALESNVSIIKDFVADDNTTSLGQARTVAANVPAKLRVRVVNSGGGTATGVLVNDEITSGNAANYQLVSVSTGTPNVNDGFDTTIGDLTAGSTATLLFTVVASQDGIYCDTATVSATSGTIGIGSDSACLTVATPHLTITKIDAPGSVIPGANYTSTIVVSNTGTATANDVVISDSLGLNSAANVRAIYVSSSLGGAAGALANNVITANTVSIPANESMTFTVVSRIPPGAVSGTYCDTATVTSSNAETKQASDCVDVPAFSALQTQLVDLNDPVAVQAEVTYFSVLYVEALSNEGVRANVMTYSFGLVSPTVLGIPGVFQVVSTRVYLDSAPVRDPITGMVLSDTSSPTAVLLMQGTDYTVDNSTAGLQLLDMTPSVVLQPNTALYLVHVVMVPSGTPTNKLYTTSYIWDSVGTVNPLNTYEASSSEPTTVLP